MKGFDVQKLFNFCEVLNSCNFYSLSIVIKKKLVSSDQTFVFFQTSLSCFTICQTLLTPALPDIESREELCGIHTSPTPPWNI